MIFEAQHHVGWRRQRALVALGRTRAPEGIPALALALRDRNRDVRLAALRYEWQGPLGAPTHYQARSRFVDLGVKARETLPGFAQLAGTFEASEAGGRVQLDARGAELELPRVFADPRLAFDVLAGELAWKRDGARFSIDVPSLTFTNADLSGNAFGSYVYSGDGPGKIDVSALLSRADAWRQLGRYGEALSDYADAVGEDKQEPAGYLGRA